MLVTHYIRYELINGERCNPVRRAFSDSTFGGNPESEAIAERQCRLWNGIKWHFAPDIPEKEAEPI